VEPHGPDSEDGPKGESIVRTTGPEPSRGSGEMEEMSQPKVRNWYRPDNWL